MSRVRRPKDKEALVKQLLDGNPFQTYRDALVFAAALGYARRRREPFTETEEPIRWELFETAAADLLAAMMAATSSGEVAILSPDRIDDQINAFEEFANGGLAELAEMVERRPELRASDILLELVLHEEGVDGPQADLDLDAIAEEFSA